MTMSPDVSTAGAYMAHHSRSFRFAALTLPTASRVRIERVYAWCRHTDNIVDVPSTAPNISADDIDRELDAWLAKSRAAFNGAVTGDRLTDAVMTDLRESGGSFDFPEALVRGVRSDLRFSFFETSDDLRAYTYDVAAVVGLWLSALFGVRDPAMLERAAALGHAMQLTNILRDVGEDLASGRIYLPLERLRARGVSLFDLYAMRSRRWPITTAYREVIEDLISRADADYALAWEAIPELPAEFARCVAVAASIYAGIHDEIRANGYDNFNRRARTSFPKKLKLAARGLQRVVLPPGWTKRQPKRPLMHKFPRVMELSSGDVDFTISPSCSCNVNVQPTPQYGQIVSTAV
jgi:phytoene synthase